MKFWLLIFLISYSTFAQSETVKVEADLCKGGPVLESTGWLFQHRGHGYVVGAAGKTLAGGCHRIVVRRQKHTAHLVANAWGEGISLFRIANLNVQGLGTLASLVGPTLPGPGDSVSVVGVSLGDEDPRPTLGFRVLDSRSARHSFPFVPTALEIQGTSMDAGWIGGPIFDSKGKIVGLVSDQFLKMVPGMAVRPMLWQSPDSPAQWLALSTKGWTTAWVDNHLAQKAPFALDAKAQLAQRTEVHSGGLRFSMDCPPPGSSGGGGPIGGGDGVGIGGANSKSPYCSVVVHASPRAVDWPYPQWEGWRKKVLSALGQGRSVRIPFLFTRRFKELQVVPVWNVADFFRRLGDQTNRIHTLIEPTTKAAPWNRLALLAKVHQPILAEWHAQHYHSFPELLLLCKRAYLTLELVTGSASGELTHADLEALLDKTYQWPWTNLKTWYPEKVKALRKDLAEIHSHLGS